MGGTSSTPGVVIEERNDLSRENRNRSENPFGSSARDSHRQPHPSSISSTSSSTVFNSRPSEVLHVFGSKPQPSRSSTTISSRTPTVVPASVTPFSNRPQISSSSTSNTTVTPKPEQKVAPLYHEPTIMAQGPGRVVPQMELGSRVPMKKKDTESQTNETKKKSVGVNATWVLDITPYQFFYQGTEGEYHGPHNECEMQEWYRRGFFPSQNQNGTIRMVHGEIEREVTLRQLIEWNGSRAPFSMTMVEADEMDRFSIIAESFTQQFPKRIGRLVFLSKDKEGEAAALRIAELESEVVVLRSTNTRLKEMKKPIERPSYLFPLLHVIILSPEKYLSVEDAATAISRLRSMFICVSGVSFEKECKRFFFPMSCVICETKEFTSTCTLFAHITGRIHQQNIWEHESGVTMEDVVFWGELIEKAGIMKEVQSGVKRLIDIVDSEDASRVKAQTPVTTYDVSTNVLPSKDCEQSQKSVLTITSKKITAVSSQKPCIDSRGFRGLPDLGDDKPCTLPLFTDTKTAAIPTIERNNAELRIVTVNSIKQSGINHQKLAELIGERVSAQKNTRCRYCAVRLHGIEMFLDHALSIDHLNNLYNSTRKFLECDLVFWEHILSKCAVKAKSSTPPLPTSNTPQLSILSTRAAELLCQLPLYSDTTDTKKPVLTLNDCLARITSIVNITNNTYSKSLLSKIINHHSYPRPSFKDAMYCRYCDFQLTTVSSTVIHALSKKHVSKIYERKRVVLCEDVEFWEKLIREDTVTQASSEVCTNAKLGKHTGKPTCTVPLVGGRSKKDAKAGEYYEESVALHSLSELRNLGLQKSGQLIPLNKGFQGGPPKQMEVCIHCVSGLHGPSTALQHLLAESHMKKLYSNGFVVCREDFDYWKNLIMQHKK